ncbi:hypothetical protein [uncultured Shewanella sp.]|uniref:hypothetical protein n=1 Tax=uncultured Shewanella sp. TaxID=173975 RepID=UPI00261CEB99|nr:hypothetical protein [uncultured Shewanella sp.]
MTRRVNYEFEATKNSHGEFICDLVSEIPSNPYFDEDLHEEHSFRFQPGSHYQAFDAAQADRVFKQSYQRNFVAGHQDYIDNMRKQFDAMRQAMLEQMESFTFVKNISK